MERQWNEKLNGVLEQIGLTPIVADPCTYCGVIGNSRVYLAVYVDDMLIVSENQEAANKIKRELMKCFEVKDLGEARYCLGIEINKQSGKITLIQKKYKKDLLERYGTEKCNTVSTPMDKDVVFEKTDTRR